MRPIEASSFHPFDHEIVSVDQSTYPAEPISPVETIWPRFMVGQMLSCRTGMKVRGTTSIVALPVASNSALGCRWPASRPRSPSRAARAARTSASGGGAAAVSGGAPPAVPDHVAETSAGGAQRLSGAVVLNVPRRSYRDVPARFQDGASGGAGRASGARSPGLTRVALRVTMQADVGRNSGPSTMMSKSPGQRARPLARRSAPTTRSCLRRQRPCGCAARCGCAGKERA